MTPQQVIKTILPNLGKILTEKGWQHVYNKHSGVFWKNGCLLCFGDNQDRTIKEIDCIPCVKACYTQKQIHDRVNGWYMEKCGYVLDSGFITSGVASVIAYGEKSVKNQKVLEQLLNTWEKLAVASAGELIGYQSSFKKVQKPVVQNAFIETDVGIRNTMMFKAVKDIQTLKCDACYKVLDIVDANIVYIEVASDPKTGTLIVPTGIQYSISWKMLHHLEELGVVKAVQIKQYASFYEETELVPETTTQYTHSLPDYFYSFGLSKEQLNNVSVIMGKCGNVSSLLNRNLFPSESYLESLFDTRIDPCNWITSIISEESATKLSYVLRNNLNPSSFIMDEVDAEYLDILISDIENSWDEYRNAHRFSGDDIALAKSMFSFGCYVKDDSKVLEEFIRFIGNMSGLGKVASQLLAHGNKKDNCYLMPWSLVEDKKSLLEYLTMPDLILDNGISWNDSLHHMFENIRYLGFNPKIGFYLQSQISKIGKEQNSVVVYNGGNEPKWRAIRINEKSFSYGSPVYCDHVNNLCIS